MTIDRLGQSYHILLRKSSEKNRKLQKVSGKSAEVSPNTMSKKRKPCRMSNELYRNMIKNRNNEKSLDLNFKLNQYRL